MSLVNKKFTDLTTGRVVQVIDQFENIAVLDDKSRIKVDRLSNKNYYDEFIDPKTFLKNESLFANFADKIHKSLDTIPDDSIQRISVVREDVPDDNYYDQYKTQKQHSQFELSNINTNTIRPISNEPAIMMSDPEVERLELMRKYGVVNGNNNPVPNSIIESNLSNLNNQMEKMKSFGLIEEDVNNNNTNITQNIDDILLNGVKMEEASFIPKKTAAIIKEKMPGQWNQAVEAHNNVPQKQNFIPVKPDSDPILEMFRNVKRNTKFDINLSISEKIPRLDFIEMMEDSYNRSIIDFLADEFTNKLLNDPSIIRNIIKSSITEMVYKDNKIEDNEKNIETVI